MGGLPARAARIVNDPSSAISTGDGPDLDTRHALASDTLARLGSSLPPRPGPVQDLLATPSHGREEVIALAESDPVFAARLLGVVNAAGGGDGAPQSAGDAVADLGSRPARALGLGLASHALVIDPSVGEGWLEGWWDMSLCRAHAAQLAHAAIEPNCGRVAFTLGLICDIALPLMMRMDPVFYRENIPAGLDTEAWCALERTRFGVDHAQAGAHLLSQWDVPASVCRLVRAHHEAPQSGDDLPLRTALYLASLMPHDGHTYPRGEEAAALSTLHERLLADRYATPESFLESARFAASRRLRRDRPRDDGRGLDRPTLMAKAAADCIELVTQTHRLETARNRQAQDLSALRFEAYSDPLTKTLNRRGFFDLARQRLEKHCGDLSVCCMLLDLNKFKPVNDTYGHDVGDLLLRGLAKLLRRSVSRTDLIGRLGGDEFVVLITDLTETGARSAAQRLYDTCHNAQLRVSDELTLQLGLSLGAVFEPQLDEGTGLDKMLAAADELMYRQKRTGQPGLQFGRVNPVAPGDDAQDEGIDAVDITPAAPRRASAAEPGALDPQI